MELIKDIFRFDYMGSAEFEFGEVPKTIEKIAKSRKGYTAFTIKVKYKYHEYREKKDYEGIKEIYVICNKIDMDEIVKRISKFALKSYGGDTKEMVFLSEALASVEYCHKDYQGWLELDNGYFFFSNEEMFNKTRELFQIKMGKLK